MKKYTAFIIPMTLLFIGASCNNQPFMHVRSADTNTPANETMKKAGENAAVIANINQSPWSEGRSVILRNAIPQRYSLLYSKTSVDFTAPETWSVPANVDDITVSTKGFASLQLNRIDPESGATFQEDGVTLRPNGATVYLTVLNDVNPDNALQYTYADSNLHADGYIPHGTDGPRSAVPRPTIYKKMSVDDKRALWVEYADPSQKDATYIDLFVDAGNRTYFTVQLHFGNGADTTKIHDEMNQFVSAVKIRTS